MAISRIRHVFGSNPLISISNQTRLSFWFKLGFSCSTPLSSEFFLGKNDLNAFRSVDCQAKSSVRTVDEIKIKKESDFIKLRVSGRSFLHNQIRIMVGTLIQVGKEIFKETSNKSNEITVLLSPAASSFDQFLNFENRGNAFKSLISEIWEL